MDLLNNGSCAHIRELGKVFHFRRGSFVLKASSLYIAQTGLKRPIPLPQFPKCSYYGCIQLCQAKSILYKHFVIDWYIFFPNSKGIISMKIQICLSKSCIPEQESL